MNRDLLAPNHPEHKRSNFVAWDSADELVGEMCAAGGKDDAARFDAHPGRNFRIRPVGRGELLTLGDPSKGYTAVRQLASGGRIRLFGTAKEEPPTWEFPARAEEACRRAQVARTIPPDELAEIKRCMMQRELVREQGTKS
jgi:hypothetical protein